mmetsp:Transcript_52300/g.93340  ORF Transcript_52300/g.93340 Transcript_52300/m.93340 type:complete len:233 (+) Transcript_52300:2225-2923(+)
MHPVVHFIRLLQPPENTDGVQHRGLLNKHLLEPALKRRVFFHVLLVFVKRCGPDTAELSPCQHWLKEVGSIHGPLALASPEHQVDLINEENHASVRICHFFEYRLQPFFELTAVGSTRDEGTHVQTPQLTLQGAGDVTTDNPLGQAFNNCRLAHSWLPNKHWIVLSAAGQDTDDSANFIIAAYDRIQLPHLCQFNHVDAVLAECVKCPFCSFIVHLACPPDERDDLLTFVAG